MFAITFANRLAADEFIAVAIQAEDIHREADDILNAERIAEIADMVEAMIADGLRPLSLNDELRDAAEGIHEDMRTLADTAADVTIG